MLIDTTILVGGGGSFVSLLLEMKVQSISGMLTGKISFRYMRFFHYGYVRSRGGCITPAVCNDNDGVTSVCVCVCVVVATVFVKRSE